MKRLIISADDFGLSPLFNKRILELIESSNITAVGVIIERINDHQGDQVEKLLFLKGRKEISLGLHVEFNSANYAEEIVRQFDCFNYKLKLKPDYVDIHKPTHLKEGYPAIQQFCLKQKLPCRNLSLFDPDIMLPEMTKAPRSTLDASRKSIEEIENWLTNLEEGVHEIIFHPGYYDKDSKSSLNKEREIDAENITRLAPLISLYGINKVNYSSLILSNKS